MSSNDVKHTRNRRSKKVGSSWTARERRLRNYIATNMEEAVDRNQRTGNDSENVAECLPQHTEHQFVNNHEHEEIVQGFDALIDNDSTTSEQVTLDADVLDCIKSIRRRLQVMTKLVILGIMSLYGACGLTTRQYDHMIAIVFIANAQFKMPSSSSLRKVKWPFLINEIFPKSEIVDFPCDHRFQTANASPPTTQSPTENFLSGVRDSSAAPVSEEAPHDFQETEHTVATRRCSDKVHGMRKTKQALIVPISEWGKYDLSNCIFIDELLDNQESNTPHTTNERTIERSRLVANASEVAKEVDSLFVKHGSISVPSKRGDIVQVQTASSSSGINPSDFLQSIPSRTSEDASDVYLRGKISFSFCPGSETEALYSNKSCRSDLVSENVEQLSQHELYILKLLKYSLTTDRTCMESPLSNLINSEDFVLYPGDVCTVLLKEHSSSDNIQSFLLLCNRFWRTQKENCSQIVYYFSCDFSVPSSAHLNIEYKAQIVNDPKLLSRSRMQKNTSNKNCKSTFGNLNDGTPFYTYRVLLYCDDFKPRSALFPKGSVGGCYFVPLSTGIRRRRAGSSVRTISLTPTGVSTNHVLNHIIPDIVKGATEGFKTVDAGGKQVRMFIEVVGFIGDYPESSKVIDVLHHSARAPCTVCSFRHRTAVSTARYAYSLIIHSQHTSFRRSLRKTMAMRSAKVSEDDCNFLGMCNGTDTDVNDDGRWPLLKLACELDKCKLNVPLTDDNKPVVNVEFDPYSRNVIAPDHLLAGIGKFLLESIFVNLPTMELRSKLDVLLCHSLRRMGQGSHTYIYKEDTKSLNSMSMSNIYAVLLVVGPHLLSFGDQADASLLEMLEVYAKLVRLTFWWPQYLIDGVDHFHLVHGEDQSKYHGILLDLAMKFISLVRDKCETSGQVRSRLDKPNLHRLLELYQHTIPRFSHALFCSDMSFEHNHQPLKSSLLRNTNPTCHISAVYHTLGLDWFARICEQLAHRSAHNSNSDHNTKLEQISFSLRRLFFGEEVTKLARDSTTHVESLMNDLDSHLNSILCERFVLLMNRWYSSRICTWSTGKWLGTCAKPQRQKQRKQGNTKTTSHAVENFVLDKHTFDRACQHLEEFLQSCGGCEYIHEMDSTYFRQTIGSFTRRRYPHHRVNIGDFVECLVDNVNNSHIVTPSTTGFGTRQVYSVHGIVGTSEHRAQEERENHDEATVWLLVVNGTKETHADNREYHNFSTPSYSNIQYLPMASTVRKCFQIHACHLDGPCIYSKDKKMVAHSRRQCKSTYMILNGENGYPPRRA